MQKLARQHAPLCRAELEVLAQKYLKEFLPYFMSQPEGSIDLEITIEFSLKMRKKLGLAFLFENRIRLNQLYFAQDSSLLPYTLFHELTHLWLYNCHLDPSHTWRFYQKMQEFSFTSYPVDPDVHQHTRIAEEAQHVYSCPNCENRWYVKQQLTYAIFCGHCFDIEGEQYIATIHLPKSVVSAA